MCTLLAIALFLNVSRDVVTNRKEKNNLFGVIQICQVINMPVISKFILLDWTECSGKCKSKFLQFCILFQVIYPQKIKKILWILKITKLKPSTI